MSGLRRLAFPAWVALLATAAAAVPATAQVVAIQGGTVIPVSGPRIEGGTVLLRDGKIAAVGRNVDIPRGAQVVDATGKFVLPGLVDAMSYYGISGSDLNETTSASTPQLRALEAYYPFGQFSDGGEATSPRAKDLLQGGVTTHYIAPADATVIGGQGSVVKAAGRTWEELILRDPAAMDMTLGQRPATTFGEASRSPGSRMAVISLLREQLVKAQEYQAKTSPPRDLGMEAMSALLAGEYPARIQANRTTEIREALTLAREFGFDLVLDSGISADQIAAELVSAGVPVVLGPISHPWISGEEIPDQGEYAAPDERRAARLQAAGVKFAIASFSRSFGSLGPSGSGQWLLLDAALAAGYGLTETQVLRAITLSPAEILGVADRVGSLEVGKDADVIILDGPPLSVMSWVERVFVGGEEVYVKD